MTFNDNDIVIQVNKSHVLDNQCDNETWSVVEMV